MQPVYRADKLVILVGFLKALNSLTPKSQSRPVQGHGTPSRSKMKESGIEIKVEIMHSFRN
jgi:hypothetical protein